MADSAFFTAAARPQSQQRIRWNSGHNLIFPDRAEYFWARADGGGKGPRPVAPNRGAQRVNYDELMMYTETAHLNFSFFFEIPYRSNDAVGALAGSGFGDMTIGTKSLLMDCELLQITFQMRTTIPQGNPLQGLGVGHVSLEPSLLFGLNVAPDRYLQAQLSEWIPIAGDPTYAGSILHYHFAYNRVLLHAQHDVKLISTLGLNGFSFQDGSYTDPNLGTLSANHYTYLSAGPGVRLVICNKIDFGVAADFAMTKQHFAQQLVRTEFRWRY